MKTFNDLLSELVNMSGEEQQSVLTDENYLSNFDISLDDAETIRQDLLLGISILDNPKFK